MSLIARSLFVSILAPYALMGSGIWNEIVDGSGDAPRFPNDAQITVGVGPLTDIIGRLTNGFTGADMYEIEITDFLAFSATTFPVGKNGILDPALYLFDSTGHGVYGNHDISPSNFEAMLPAGDPNGPQSNGIYFLLIVPDNNDPLNKFGNNIFPCICTPGVFGPSAKNTVIKDYSNFGVGPDGSGKYDIQLTGAAFAETPEPGTLALLGLGLAAAALISRRSK